MSPLARSVFCITLMCAGSSVLSSDITSEDTVSSASESWAGLMTALDTRAYGSRDLRILENWSDVISAVNISQDCRDSLRKYWRSLAEWEAWAVQMADASGDWPSGILGSRVTSFGSFDQCLKIRSLDQSPDFRGQYCMLGFQSPLLTEYYDSKGSYALRNEKYEDTHGKPPEWVSDFLHRSGPKLKKTTFFLGTCVPSACSGGEVTAIYAHESNPLGLKVTTHDCQIESQIIWSTSDIAAMVFFLLIAVLCILGTAVDTIGEWLHGDEKGTTLNYFNWVRPFSLTANLSHLLGEQGRHAGGSLACLGGLKVLTTVWVISFHVCTIYYEKKISLLSDTLGITDGWVGYLGAVFVDHSPVTVDTFFCISGFLLVFTTWKKIEDCGRIFNIFKFMLLKYLRLTPPLALTWCAFMLMYKSGSGPLWNSYLSPIYDTCQTSWWGNFLYINNLLDNKECLKHTWYLAALMQCHLTGIVLLCILYRWPITGIVLSSTLVVGTIASLAWMAIVKNYPLPKPFYLQDLIFFNDFYKTSHYGMEYHVNSYICGMAAGFIYLKHKKDIHTRLNLLCWFACACVAFFVVYGKFCLPEERAVVALYHATYRTLWGACMGWVIYACCHGQGGVANRILSWSGFTVLGKLTYLVYLLHVPILLAIQASTREVASYGHLSTILNILGVTVATFILSAIAYVTVELPFTTITTYIFKRGTEGKTI